MFSIIFSNNKFLCQINLISSLPSSTSNSSIVELLQLSFFCSFDIFFLYPLFYENTMCTSSLMCTVHCCFTLALQSLFLSLVEARTHFCSLGSEAVFCCALLHVRLCQLLTFCYCRLLDAVTRVVFYPNGTLTMTFSKPFYHMQRTPVYDCTYFFSFWKHKMYMYCLINLSLFIFSSNMHFCPNLKLIEDKSIFF